MFNTSISTTPFPYVLHEGKLIFNRTSSYLLELTHNLVIVGSITAVGKLSGAQRKSFDDQERNFDGPRDSSETMPFLHGEGLSVLNSWDRSWAFHIGLSISTKFVKQPEIVNEPLSTTSSFAVEPIPSTSSTAAEDTSSTSPAPQEPSPAHAEIKRLLGVMANYHLELFPGLETSDYVDLIITSLKQYQNVNLMRK